MELVALTIAQPISGNFAKASGVCAVLSPIALVYQACRPYDQASRP
jgi:hypothetical protein